MTEQTIPENTDLAAVFAGRRFPTDTVDVLLDDSINVDIKRVREEIEEAIQGGDAQAEDKGRLEEKLKGFLKERSKSFTVIHLTEVPEHLKNALVNKLMRKFPIETDVLGRPIPNPEADDETVIARWALHIEKIVLPGGAEILVGEPEAKMIYQNAPVLALRQIQKALDALIEAPAKGHEIAIQEMDFLSSASREG